MDTIKSLESLQETIPRNSISFFSPVDFHRNGTVILSPTNETAAFEWERQVENVGGANSGSEIWSEITHELSKNRITSPNISDALKISENP